MNSVFDKILEYFYQKKPKKGNKNKRKKKQKKSPTESWLCPVQVIIKCSILNLSEMKI